MSSSGPNQSSQPNQASPSSRHQAQRTVPVRLGLGIILILIAVLCAGVARVLAAGGPHAYDPQATPPSAGYALSAIKIYQLSTPAGLAGAKTSGADPAGTDPRCFYATVGSTLAAQRPVTLLSKKDDDRDLHVFATFRVAQSGRFTISCTGLSSVFVDDADNAQPDYSAVLIILSAFAGALGVALALSGAGGDFSTASRHKVAARSHEVRRSEPETSL